MEEITVKEFEKIPTMYDDDLNIVRMNLKVGDYYMMREPAGDKAAGDVCCVYEVIRLTKTGHESKMTTLRIM